MATAPRRRPRRLSSLAGAGGRRPRPPNAAGRVFSVLRIFSPGGPRHRRPRLAVLSSVQGGELKWSNVTRLKAARKNFGRDTARPLRRGPSARGTPLRLHRRRSARAAGSERRANTVSRGRPQCLVHPVVVVPNEDFRFAVLGTDATSAAGPFAIAILYSRPQRGMRQPGVCPQGWSQPAP
jgi:hypothetical protein